MPNLDTILKNIMSYNVSGGMTDKGKSFAISAAGDYMSWTFDSNTPSVINDVTCKTGGNATTVCTEVSWKPLVIKTYGKVYSLPFDKEFLMKIYYTAKGRLAETDFWNAATLEPSLLLVFGFELRNGKWWPVTETAWKGKDFMPEAGEKPREVKPLVINNNGKAVLQIRPMRMIVCLEFACTAPAINCEPTETVSACRIHPQQYILSSMNYKLEESITHVMRPERNEHDHHHGDPHPDEDQMVGSYSIGCYTDRNDALPSPLGPFPFWKGTFHYYNLDTKKEFCAVDPNRKKRVLKEKTEIWRLDHYDQYDITLAERQGLYDNLHIAAGIKAPAKLIKALKKFKGTEKAMEFLHMAPSCVHDCLHFHWRWGPLVKYASPLHPKRWFWGWDDEKPFKERGAPLVPKNQTIYIQPLNSRGFNYKVSINEAVAPGKWQYIFHHGFYYPVSIDFSFQNGMIGGSVFKAAHAYLKDLGLQAIAESSWGMFYFNARYAIDPQEMTIREGCRFNLDEIEKEF